MRLRKPQPEITEVAPVEFTNAGVQLFDSVSQQRRQHALAFGDSIGVIEHRTCAEVAHHSAQWSELLRENGLEPGDRVIVLAGRDREWRATLLGILQAGGVAVPCLARTPASELRAIAAHAE